MVDAPVRAMEFSHKHIWVACQTGIVSIFCIDGTILRSFVAHVEPILAICAAGDFIWTASKSEVKIWKIQVFSYFNLYFTNNVNNFYPFTKRQSNLEYLLLLVMIFYLQTMLIHLFVFLKMKVLYFL